MAHTCPKCGLTCHCGGDIDDLNFGAEPYCRHCDDKDDDEEDYYNWVGDPDDYSD